jgi:putative DNA primase/helicase
VAGAAITGPPKVSYWLDTDPKDSVKACDVARVICRGEHFAKDLGGLLHVYRHGVYVPDGAQTVARLVLKVVQVSCREDNWSRKLRDETIAYIIDGAPVLLERPPMDVVNLRNGLLYVRAEERDGKFVTARTLQAHSPEFLSTVQLPIEYDPKAPSPEAWIRFMMDVFPDDCVKAGVLWFIIAYLILPNTALHKALLFMSEEGGTGKSTC